MDNNLNNEENPVVENEPVKEQSIPCEPAPVKDTISLHKALSSNLFLAFNILLTLTFSFTAIKSNFNILILLGMIAGWIIYGMAKKGGDLSGGLGFANVVVKIYYVLNYVLSGGLFLGGVGASLVYVLKPEIINDFAKGVFTDGYVIYGDIKVTFFNVPKDTIEEIAEILNVSTADVFGLLILGLGMLMMLAGIIALVINILFIRKVSLFVGSLRKNATNPECTADDIQKAKATSGWLMFVGILTAIAGVFSIISLPVSIAGETHIFRLFSNQFGAVITGVGAAAYIVFAQWVKKFFVTQKQ